MILFSPDIAKNILPLIKDFIHHWSYQNETKLPFFNELFTGLFKSPHRKTSLILNLLASYTEIQDDFTGSRVEFATNLLLKHALDIMDSIEVPLCAELLRTLNQTHPCASAVLLERRNDWLVKFYTAPKQTVSTYIYDFYTSLIWFVKELAKFAEEIMTDLLWSQTDKQPVSLLIETLLSTFEEKPIEIICRTNLSNVFNAIEFLSLQLENKDLVRNKH